MTVLTIPLPDAHLAMRLDLDNERHRIWLTQRHLDGETNEQLAQITGLTVHAVQQLIIGIKLKYGKGPNRQERRRLERARRRRDKWATPKVDHVEHVERPSPPKTEKKQKAKVEELVLDDPNDYIIANELVEGDGQGDVLFEESEFYGEFNFRDSILDQLDRYWFYLKRMRRNSKDAYEKYRQVGAVLVPPINSRQVWQDKKEDPEEIKRLTTLSAWFKKVRPSWGCIAMGVDPLVERRERENKCYTPRFMYFSRFDKNAPPEIQMPTEEGDIYLVTIWWDMTDRKRKWGVPNDFPIFVSKDGNTIRALRTLDTRLVRVPRQHSSWDYNLIPQRAWYFPENYEKWATDHDTDVQTHLAYLFCDMMRQFENSHYAMARVSVTNGDLTAVFGINPRRLSYFFQDRDVVITSTGQRKKIIHFVRPFIREDGTPIKAHFRGAREFKWAGYDVYVTIPGRDHFLLPEFNVAVKSDFWIDPGTRTIDEGEMGRRLSRVVHGGDLRGD